MARLRLSIAKDEALRFLGHLDFLRAMERALRRAELPVAFSEGFNPHMKVNYDSALGVGVTADPYYMDLELAEERPFAEVAECLRKQLPNGIRLTDGRYVPKSAAKLMAFINYEVYRLAGPVTEPYTAAALAAALAEFNARASIPYRKITPKKTRDIDVRPIIPEAVTGTFSGGEVVLRVGILRTTAGSIKPGELWNILRMEHAVPVAEGMCIISREGAYRRTEAGVLQTPLAEVEA
ncbi:MAG: TIGR03936 family radical SAM-associated protein [Veillonellaceae bacterium]|nr:TIGR03936 family radical SAM-associated protein [Veillonellaceae bacterium]